METLVAVYPSRELAEQMKGMLIDHGLPSDKIALSPETSANAAPAESGHRGGHFWQWLFGSDVDDNDRELYNTTLIEGRTAVSVYLESGQQRGEVEKLLHSHGAIDLTENVAASGNGRCEEVAGRDAVPGTVQQQVEAEREHIPIVKEQLEVGKRETEQRYHVRVYPVARTVEEKVNLRDERVVIERRPTEAYSPTEKDLVPREFEVVERHEEPVVAKKATATEEVVVSRDVSQHTETVRDTVKETKVEVDKPDSKDQRI